MPLNCSSASRRVTEVQPIESKETHVHLPPLQARIWLERSRCEAGR